MKSILVIGMGRFGTYLALKLTELGNQVMIADKNEDTVNRLAHNFTDAVIGDCSREEVLAEIGLRHLLRHHGRELPGVARSHFPP